jgi:photosystem II stability/assembly factor-like uncharacterized protein
MSVVIAATPSGVFRIEPDGARQEDGPGAVAFLARGGDATYAITPERALWRRDKGGAWRLLANQTIDDDVWSMAADPRLPGRIYLGVSPALMYRSDDEGETWTACNSLKSMPGYETWTFPPPPHIPHVRSISPDPKVAGAVYIGVEEGGVFRSPDGGDTWESLNEGLYWDVHNIVPPQSGTELYATTGAGFHYSADEGAHWTHVPLAHRYTVPLIALRSDPGRLITIAAESPPPDWRNGGPKGAMYASTNSGRSWQRVEKGVPRSIDRMPTFLVEDDDGRACAAVAGDILVSKDRGETWSALPGGLADVKSFAVA